LKLFNENDDVLIGIVVSPHGIGGLAKVFPLTDNPERINLLQEVDLILETERRSVVIEKASLYGRFWLLKFKGIKTREEIQLLGGSKIVIPRSQRLALPDDHFYHDQLVGLKVYNSDGDLLGLIVEVISTGGHDLLMIERAGLSDRKTLVPAVKEFVRQVDLKAKKLVVDLPEGLLEL
jgi:16S rRNA processing protein RimM